MPTLDTENSELGAAQVGAGRLHPQLALDVRNGDFVRGDYDDDGADLSRLPAHLQLGLGWELHRDGGGKADLWIIGRSSNGFHAPRTGETSPRPWYESNNLVGLVGELAPGLRGAVDYVVKTSPNGVSGTTDEASVSLGYRRETGIGRLRPTLVVTARTKGDGGVYTQLGIGPELAIGAGEHAPSIDFPAHFGTGWSGFYGQDTGDVLYGDAGIGFSQPFAVGGAHGLLRFEALALIRDGTLRRLGREVSPEAETATVVPFGTVSLSIAY